MGETTIAVTETAPRDNWPAGRMPDWVDDETRLYTGFTLCVTAREWPAIIAHFDGKRTTAYLTMGGFDLDRRGPAVHRIEGDRAAFRRAVGEFFRDSYQMEVSFR